MNTEQKQTRVALLLLAVKPGWCKPIDIALICTIVMRSDSEGKCWASQQTIATLIGISTIAALRVSLDRLIDHGWLLEINRKGSQQSNILMPQFHCIPKDASPAPVISLESRHITARYYERVKALPKVLTRNGRYRMAARPHKSWAQHWGLVIQGWLDGGATVEEVFKVIDYAFDHHEDMAKRGPQCLKTSFQGWLGKVSQ